MEEPPAKETPEPGLNKIDLSQLQDFRFGTQWTEVKSVPGPRREREREREPRREGPERGEGRPRDADGGEARRDRRSFRRPAGAPAESAAPGAGSRPGFGREEPGRPTGEPRQGEGPRGGYPPRREGGPERRWSGPRFQQDQRPYQSPYFNVTFYPEDAGFSALVKAMRASCRTFELFEIARLILGKNERFVVVLTRRLPETAAPPPAPASPATEEAPPAAEAAPAASATPPPAPAAPPAPAPAKSTNPIYVAVPDGLPCESEAAALAHVLNRHLDRFFDLAVVEVEPPKGTFPFVNRCTLSGELLGPPNYHRYQQIVQQHHATRFSRMPFERFREHIETVRDPAVVSQWLEKMKQVTRYTSKPAAEGETPVVFDDVDAARAHLMATAKSRMVKAVDAARFHGKLLEAMPPGEIRRAIEGQLERQRRFPLDTANALRGRLRREGFTIFKKGAKGVSYVCAVKRKFRVPGQSFAEGISALITFLEANPLITVKDLPVKMLGITPPSTGSTPPMAVLSMSTPPMPVPPPAPPTVEPAAEPAAVAPAATAPAPAAAAPESPTIEPVATAPVATAPAPAGDSAAVPPPVPPVPLLTPEEQDKLRRMTMDLRWLVQEGYVTEFADGRLFAPPPIAEARPKIREAAEDGEEHDLESFPELPGAAETAAEAASPPAEAPPEPPPAESPAPAADAPVPAPAAAPEPLPGGDTPGPGPTGAGEAPPSETGSAPATVPESGPTPST